MEPNGALQAKTDRAGRIAPDAARIPDETLVDRAIGGDRAAFESLVRRHQRGVVNYLFRLTGLKDDALDLAQEVFLKVYLSLETFDPRYRFTTWLYRIASNYAIDQMRKKQVRTCSLQPAPGDESPPSCEPPVPGDRPGPHEALRLRELESRLEAAIAALPPAYRHLIHLRHRQHCRYDEIARIAGLPIGTVKNRIFRAREILRDQLADLLAPEV